ncbi:hypothetical protein C8R47DRAFT_359209 [Mycena vitilis]|nr:hypothetical protein C8R47DRAFT_359209 [Mycena vitilis]
MNTRSCMHCGPDGSLPIDYKCGAEKFIDDYWKMIRMAAGRDALRYWLVEFLVGHDVVLLLEHYERLCTEG